MAMNTKNAQFIRIGKLILKGVNNMTDREFVLNYQADLIVKEFLEYKKRENLKRALFFIPKLSYGTYDSSGRTEQQRAIISNNSLYYPNMNGLPSWNKFNIGGYYGEIISPHLDLSGDDSGYHQKHIVYVSSDDQPFLCELIRKKLLENYIVDATVYFEKATEKKFIFNVDLGYKYLCIKYES